MRSDTEQPLQSSSRSAAITFSRACGFSSGATASSRSSMTTSAPSPGAFSIIRTFAPGTQSSLRCSLTDAMQPVNSTFARVARRSR